MSRIRPELRERIIAYNREVAEKKEMAADLEIILNEIAKLPPGLLKRVLTEPVLQVLAKYGILID